MRWSCARTFKKTQKNNRPEGHGSKAVSRGADAGYAGEANRRARLRVKQCLAVAVETLIAVLIPLKAHSSVRKRTNSPASALL